MQNLIAGFGLELLSETAGSIRALQDIRVGLGVFLLHEAQFVIHLFNCAVNGHLWSTSLGLGLVSVLRFYLQKKKDKIPSRWYGSVRGAGRHENRMKMQDDGNVML